MLFFNGSKAFSQYSARDSVNKTRLLTVTLGGGALYIGSMVYLNEAWYANHRRSSFHFFNDNNEWLQMDKAGHTFTSYYEGIYGYKMLRWAGVNEKNAILFGGSLGMVLQTPIEILDGFSAKWGASWGDIAANTLGTALFVSQQWAWHEQHVQMKFSFTPSPYAKQKPNILGSNFAEQLIKDYNGQTYWLSGGLYHIRPSSKIPQWLNIAVGYGADGMLRGTFTDQRNDPAANNYNRSRQYFLSFDVNFLKIKSKHKWINTFSTAIAFIKVPSPTMEYHEKQGFKFHFLYF